MARHHYALTGIRRSIRQVIYALRSNDQTLADNVAVRAERLRRDAARIARVLGREVNGLDVL